MIQKSRYTESDWQRRLDKIEAALDRARERAREIARQTGTAIVYRKDGKLVHEYITEESAATKVQSPDMTRSTVLAELNNHRDAIKRFGVKRIGLFGSASRDEATPESDLDFVVELEPATFDNYMDLKLFLEDLFGRNIDLVMKDTIKPQLRDAILQETVDAPGF